MNWLGSSTVSLSSFQTQVVVNSSIALWCCGGVEYSASTVTGAAEKACSASPSVGSLYDFSTSATALTVVPGQPKVAVGVCSSYSMPISNAASLAASNVSATTIATICPSCQIFGELSGTIELLACPPLNMMSSGRTTLAF